MADFNDLMDAAFGEYIKRDSGGLNGKHND